MELRANKYFLLVVEGANKKTEDCLGCLGLHYAKPKGEPVSEERYN